MQRRHPDTAPTPRHSAHTHTHSQALTNKKQEINVTCNFYRADLSVCDRPNPIAAARADRPDMSLALPAPQLCMAQCFPGS